MRTPWLTAVLTRGGQVDAGLPWRAGPAESWEDELRHGQVRRVVGDVLVAGDVGVDAVADAPVRAQALALLLSPGVVLLGVAALWVHLGHPLAAPSRVQVAGSRSGRRSRSVASPWCPAGPARPPGRSRRSAGCG